jgi:hypothetical protein
MDHGDNVAESGLSLIIQAYEKWFSTHKAEMEQSERNECNFVLDQLTTSSRNAPVFLSKHPIWRHYVVQEEGDLVWGVFYALRLIYIDLRSHTRTLGDVDRGICEAAERQLIGGRLARMIKDRYPQVDLRETVWPGPAPPRPESWNASQRQCKPWDPHTFGLHRRPYS